jgi:hypothetical protein
MRMNKVCEAFEDGTGVFDKDGNEICGCPAAAKYLYEDGSVLWLCADCLDLWIEDEKEDMEEFADTPRGDEAERTLYLNGYL